MPNSRKIITIHDQQVLLLRFLYPFIRTMVIAACIARTIAFSGRISVHTRTAPIAANIPPTAARMRNHAQQGIPQSDVPMPAVVLNIEATADDKKLATICPITCVAVIMPMYNPACMVIQCRPA